MTSYADLGVIAIIDGVMLIDLTAIFGHGVVFSDNYEELITEMSAKLGGYVEGSIVIPKEI